MVIQCTFLLLCFLSEATCAWNGNVSVNDNIGRYGFGIYVYVCTCMHMVDGLFLYDI